MELKKYIEKGEEKAGKQIELAKILGISDGYIRMVKSKKRGLPVETCILLADYINEDRLEVIAASGLVTEKDEKKRKIFESCFKKTSQAACIGLVISLTMIMTPIPANADITTAQKQNNLYYVILCDKAYRIVVFIETFL
jgi:proteasome lid subunit RPN8/RPN11